MTIRDKGTRVRVKWERTDGFTQPWRGRFEKGREGTVLGVTHGGKVRVQWDHSARGKDYDFRMEMRYEDLEVVQ